VRARDLRLLLSTDLKRPRTPKPDLEMELIWLIWAAFYHTRKSIDGVTRPYGVTGPQMGILNRLAQSPGSSGADIARAMVISRQAVQEALITLEGKGLIERKQGPGRIVHSQLTEQGREIVHSCATELRTAGQRLISALAPHEQHLLADLLRRYLDPSSSNRT
jgi:DNA-binding MarR family transcriptional regulator